MIGRVYVVVLVALGISSCSSISGVKESVFYNKHGNSSIGCPLIEVPSKESVLVFREGDVFKTVDIKKNSPYIDVNILFQISGPNEERRDIEPIIRPPEINEVDRSIFRFNRGDIEFGNDTSKIIYLVSTKNKKNNVRCVYSNSGVFLLPNEIKNMNGVKEYVTNKPFGSLERKSFRIGVKNDTTDQRPQYMTMGLLLIGIIAVANALANSGDDVSDQNVTIGGSGN